jgi:ClpP class serine protease
MPDILSVYPNGIAVMDLIGAIYPRANMMTSSGATSVEQFASDFINTYNNPNVKGIVLNIDSPGGDARGIKAAADIINAGMRKGQKPVQAFAAGLMASAAYWIGSAVGPKNIFADATAMIGSIGVVLTAQKKSDDEYEIISSQSPYKRADPSTEEGYSKYQTMADNMAQIFVRDVATNRGVTEKKVLTDYGQGTLLIGEWAQSSGLVDKVSTLSDVVEKMAHKLSTKTMSRPMAVEGSEALGLLVNFNEDTDNNMSKISDMINKFRASDKTVATAAVDEDVKDPADTSDAPEGEQADEGQDKEGSKAAVAKTVAQVFTRESLAEDFAEGAELFATQMVIDNRVVPAQQAYAAMDLLNARIDDKMHGGTVTYVDASGIEATGTREDAVRARYQTMPKHNMTQRAINGVKDGSVIAQVLGEDDKKEKDGPMTEERRNSLLNHSTQGQAALAQRSK